MIYSYSVVDLSGLQTIEDVQGEIDKQAADGKKLVTLFNIPGSGVPCVIFETEII